MTTIVAVPFWTGIGLVSERIKELESEVGFSGR